MHVCFFNCTVAVLALYLDSLHCIAVGSMAFNAVGLSEEALDYYRQNFDMAPVGPYKLADVNRYIAHYVNMFTGRSYFTENVAFNVVYEQQLKLVLCVSSPATTSFYNKQERYIRETGLIGDIGDV